MYAIIVVAFVTDKTQKIIMLNGKKKNDIKRNTATMYGSEVKNLMTAHRLVNKCSNKRMVSR